jgi:hypothetical protein
MESSWSDSLIRSSSTHWLLPPQMPNLVHLILDLEFGLLETQVYPKECKTERKKKVK